MNPASSRVPGSGNERCNRGLAMQPGPLRRLQEVVFAGFAVGIAGCAESAAPAPACEEIAHRTFQLETPAEPSVQFYIDRCRVDVDACNDVCVAALSRAGVVGWSTACDVEFRPGMVSANATYRFTPDGANCPVFQRAPRQLGARFDGAPAQPALGNPDGSGLRGLASRTHASLWQGGHS